MELTRLSAIVFCLAFCLSANAASTRVEWSNGPGTELRDFSGNPLETGSPANYDGDRLQLGYYSFATELDPFRGSWVPLTGLAGDGTPTSIGDAGNLGPGLFGLSTTFVLTAPNNFPTSSTVPLSVRFYDSSAPASASFFNAVSNVTGTWDFAKPNTPQSVVTISLSDPGLVWQDGAGSAFKTTINQVPEPAWWAWLLGPVCVAAWQHARQGKNTARQLTVFPLRRATRSL